VKKCRFYFNFRSPYSWIGAHWIERLRPKLEVEYHPFWELDDISQDLLQQHGGEHYYTPMSKAKHLYILQDIKRITKSLDMKISWPPSPDNQHWEIPHLAYLYAREQGGGDTFFKMIHEYRWQRGKDICDKKTIAEIAGQCNLDPESTATAYEDDAIRAVSVKEMMTACEDGVFGIPFFVHGYNKFWGIDRFEYFLNSLRKETSDIPEDFGALTPIYETDHPGGCG